MLRIIGAVALSLSVCVPALSQNLYGADPGVLSALPAQSPAQSADQPLAASSLASSFSPAAKMIADFKDSDVKFDVNELVNILRDRRHEGWVLAAYPDPRTGQPLIGAGFSLDLQEREHPQRDPLNPHPFLEPASAELWQGAGFAPERLDEILRVFHERERQWSKRTWRRQLYSLPPQISDEDATQLVRVGAIQAIYNARAYCREFDRLTGPQQMAMAQLVYQMGVNLEHFNTFLTTINSLFEPALVPQAVQLDAISEGAEALQSAEDLSPEHWQGVQKSLMGSQWAHKYRTRAIAVIAMLDPSYGDDPGAAERRVSAVLRPVAASRRHGVATAGTHEVAASTHRRHGARSRRTARVRNRKRT